MSDRLSTAILLEDLEAARAPQFMLRKARDGQYNDYQSDSAHPIMDLVRDATVWNLTHIVEQAKAGKYDGTREESEAWFAREGQSMVEDATTPRPCNLAEMPGDFVELEEVQIVEWHPLPNGQGPPTQVHLLLKLAGVPDLTQVLRFTGPDMLARIVNALTEHGSNVFGQDFVRRLRQPPQEDTR